MTRGLRTGWLAAIGLSALAAICLSALAAIGLSALATTSPAMRLEGASSPLILAALPGVSTTPSTGTDPSPAGSPQPAPCTCSTIKSTNGWCEAHGVGYVAMVRIRSKMLYETLDAHGHTLDLSTFECPSCKKAIVTDGFCDQHKNGFVHGQAYFSRLTYELARGETRDPAGITCPVCRRNSRGHGWCKRHELGMVGNIAIKDRPSYERVLKRIDLLEAAIKASERCQYCAVAMVTDTMCPYCRITYKDGKPLPR